jgi:hypothetical protein
VYVREDDEVQTTKREVVHRKYKSDESSYLVISEDGVPMNLEKFEYRSLQLVLLAS